MKTQAVPMPPVRAKWKRVLIDSAIARIVIFVALVLVIGTAMTVAYSIAGWKSLPVDGGPRIALDFLLRLVPMGVGYYVIVRFIERRRVDELGWRDMVPHLAIGILGGAALMAGVIGVLWLAGSYTVTAVNTGVLWLRSLLIFGLATGIAEEIIFRGVLFRIIDERWGLWPALTVSALFFGFAHASNANATLWSSIAIAIEAGILLGVVYHVTKSLWVCIGMHMAWNFFEGTVFGSAVSGIAARGSWLQPQFSGPDWLTGGSFGIEASVLTVLLSLAASFALLAARQRRRRENELQLQGAA